MESRLPQPKVVLKKAISTMDINLRSNNRKMEEQTNTTTNNMKNNLQKTKSSQNITARTVNENKRPVTSTLVRSKTVATITRSNTMLKGIKRPGGTVANEIEKKKPNVKPVTKTTDASKVNKRPLGSNSVANKAAQSTSATMKPKPSKWDIKGRLAHTSEELVSMRGKYKEVSTKCSEMQELLDSLKSSETESKLKAEKLEVSNAKLSNELELLQTEVEKMHKTEKDLKVRLKESEESLKNISEMLKGCQEKCSAQENLLSRHAAEVRNLKSDLEHQKQVNEELTNIRDELQSLVHTMDKDRRVLHNTIQEMKGNIRVFCRVRPRTPKESLKTLCSINFVDECTIEVGKSDGSDSMSCSGKIRGTRQEFSFDKVFPPNTSQADIFAELALLVQSALEGYNVCVFAYGQTGSGKTYTMEGLPGLETEGMIPRTVRHIFTEMKEFQLLGWEYKIEASFLEIYNEHIIDLLDSQPKNLEIRMADAKGSDLYVSNLQVEEIHSPEELHECLLRAQRNRVVAATHANERSSRSHSVARIRLIGTHASKEEVSIGNLNLVDLAGSEKLKSEEAVRNAETKNINKSLANLGNVILALLKKQEHIPYRNSKLTHLLMPSLGGNSKTLMLLNISPLDECYNETLNSLRFGSNVNNCKTGSIKRTRTVLQS